MQLSILKSLLQGVIRSVLALAIVTIHTAGAQGTGPLFDSVQWDGTNLVVLHQGHFVKRIGQVFAPNGSEVKGVDRPKSDGTGPMGLMVGRAFYVDGQFIFNRRVKGTDQTGPFQESVLLEHDGKTWERKYFFRTQKSPCVLYPLEGGKVLAVDGSGQLFKKDSKPVPFAVLQPKQSGELEVRDTFDAGMEKPFFDAKGRPTYPKLHLEFFAPAYARLEKHFVLASSYGLFWIFDGEKGYLRRVARLYPEIKDKDFEGNSLILGLLGFNPRPDGQLLISARMEDAVRWGTLGNPMPGQIAELGNTQEQWADRVNKKFPHVEWWTLNPETGKFSLEAPPQGVSDRLGSSQQARDFNWRFKVDGNLHIYGKKEQIGEPPVEVGKDGKDGKEKSSKK